MKAKELAEELLKYPEFKVQVVIRPPLGSLQFYGSLHLYGISVIAYIGYSDKIIVLDVDENNYDIPH